ncbi:Rap1a/Tai family immunity protein [Rhizobium leguminosarum]|uniref:Rap1a/Tai family immunity protein n=1 Tax=Rhizobium leguminosarum TaxID=384 RepID=UPI003516634E
MRAILAAAMLLTASSADAQLFNGNEIYEYCKGARSLATAYVGGWSDSHMNDDQIISLAQATSPDEPTRNHIKFYAGQLKGNICIPPKVTLGQMVDVLCKYLEDHPEDRQLSMSGHFNVAFGTAWPCVRD